MRRPPVRDKRSPHFAAEFAVTALFWGLWVYLVTPLISLLLWFGGVHVFVEQMIILGGYEALLEKLTAYGLVVLAIMGVVSSWVVWNVRRYGEHNTRIRVLAPVTLQESADAAGVAVRKIEALQRAKRVVLHFDKHDHIQIEAVTARSTAPTGRGGSPTN